jgi:hypothetical protein
MALAALSAGSPQQLRLLPPRPRRRSVSHCQSLADDYFFLATFRLVFLAAVFLASGFVFALALALALAFFAMLPS